MKKIISTIIASVILLLATAIPVFGTEDSPLLYDGAELFSEDEELELAEKLEEATETHGVDFAIATFASTNGQMADEFAEEYCTSCGFGDGDKEGAALLFITLDDEYGDRCYVITVKGNGTADVVLSEVEDVVAYHLRNDEFFLAAESFVDECEYQINRGPVVETFNVGKSIVISIVIGLIAALIITGVWKSQLNSAEMQRGAANYTKSGSMKITSARDLFLYKTVTRTKKPQSSSGGSRGGGGGSRSVRGKF